MRGFELQINFSHLWWGGKRLCFKHKNTVGLQIFVCRSIRTLNISPLHLLPAVRAYSFSSVFSQSAISLSAGHQRGSFHYFKVLVAAGTSNFTVKQFLLQCPFLTEWKLWSLQCRLLSRPEISESAYVSALTLTNYFLRHFTGNNKVVIYLRKTFQKSFTNIRVMIQRDATKFRVVNLCFRYTFLGT